MENDYYMSEEDVKLEEKYNSFIKQSVSAVHALAELNECSLPILFNEDLIKFIKDSLHKHNVERKQSER